MCGSEPRRVDRALRASFGLNALQTPVVVDQYYYKSYINFSYRVKIGSVHLNKQNKLTRKKNFRRRTQRRHFSINKCLISIRLTKFDLLLQNFILHRNIQISHTRTQNVDSIRKTLHLSAPATQWTSLAVKMQKGVGQGHGRLGQFF